MGKCDNVGFQLCPFDSHYRTSYAGDCIYEAPGLSFDKIEDQDCSGKYGDYSNLDVAIQACSKDNNCQGVLNGFCDDSNFQLCPIGADFLEASDSSCIFSKSR